MGVEIFYAGRADSVALSIPGKGSFIQYLSTPFEELDVRALQDE